MPLGLIGTKVGMTQVYTEKGQMAPVTVLQVGPCTVLQVKARADGQVTLAGCVDSVEEKLRLARSLRVLQTRSSWRRGRAGHAGPAFGWALAAILALRARRLDDPRRAA